MTRQLWKHRGSGEVWAVEFGSDGHVAAACGPLHYSEQSYKLLAHMHYDPEEGEAIAAHEDEFVLVEPN